MQPWLSRRLSDMDGREDTAAGKYMTTYIHTCIHKYVFRCKTTLLTFIHQIAFTRGKVMVFDHPNLADSPDFASQLDEGAGLCWEIAVNVVNKVDAMKHWIMSLSVCVLGYQIHVCCRIFS